MQKEILHVPNSSPASQVREEGFAIIAHLISNSEVAELCAVLEQVEGEESVRQRGGSAFAIRNLLALSPAIAQLAIRPDVLAPVSEVLGANPRPVRGILFNKTPDANWKVPWHQDVTIAVRERVELPGWGPWSEKAGVLHVQPPAEILDAILSLRISLDPTSAGNGALQVIAGSHRLGRLKDEGIAKLRDESVPVTCEVPAGGAMLMKPLLLHASSPATSPTNRRVIHIDYSAVNLPPPLQWAE